MKLEFDRLKDKILGCWNGKNIGGVLGAPFEGMRQVNQVDFYIQDLDGNPPPNDDLDLQLVWLCGVEKYGRQINAALLGEYWLSYIIPDWVEYGTGKNNLRAGIMPPLSGSLSNDFKDSCGCFIRSELWACLCPGHPALAARYAYEDAVVDHADEGMYAEIFCAALQSAAFVESDKYKLIDIGLSYLPQDCDVAKAVRLVIQSYQSGDSYLDARKKLLTQVPGNFGIQAKKLKDIKDDFPIARAGYDAPSNIGIVVIGWLYGEDDFGKSLCIAVNCGEDTDCTSATLGAILGIIHGNEKLPEKWLKPVGGVINTCCINQLNGIDIPGTVEELSDRVLWNIPGFLGRAYCDTLYSGNGFTVETLPEEELFYDPADQYLAGSASVQDLSVGDLLKLSPYGIRYDFSTFTAVLDYLEEPYIRLNQPKKFRLTLYANQLTGHQQFAKVHLTAPEGVLLPQGEYFAGPLQNRYKSKLSFDFEIIAEAIHTPTLELLIDISMSGRHSYGVVKASFLPTV